MVDFWGLQIGVCRETENRDGMVRRRPLGAPAAIPLVVIALLLAGSQVFSLLRPPVPVTALASLERESRTAAQVEETTRTEP